MKINKKIDFFFIEKNFNFHHEIYLFFIEINFIFHHKIDLFFILIINKYQN